MPLATRHFFLLTKCIEWVVGFRHERGKKRTSLVTFSTNPMNPELERSVTLSLSGYLELSPYDITGVFFRAGGALNIVNSSTDLDLPIAFNPV